MEELEQIWENLLTELEHNFNRKPDLQSLLFLVGVQEFGQIHRTFSKEEKQDLMHIGVCHLLAGAGYFAFKSKDPDGWPHYEPVQSMPIDIKNLSSQETLLKREMLRYFGKC